MVMVVGGGNSVSGGGTELAGKSGWWRILLVGWAESKVKKDKIKRSLIMLLMLIPYWLFVSLGSCYLGLFSSLVSSRLPIRCMCV